MSSDTSAWQTTPIEHPHLQAPSTTSKPSKMTDQSSESLFVASAAPNLDSCEMDTSIELATDNFEINTTTASAAPDLDSCQMDCDISFEQSLPANGAAPDLNSCQMDCDIPVEPSNSDFETNPTAAKRAVGVVEICETILLRLPAKNIVRVRAIHSHIRSIVDTSPMIQDKLFLVPGKPLDPWAFIRNADGKKLKVYAGVQALDWVQRAEKGEAGVSTIHPVIYNPLVANGKPLLPRYDLYARLRFACTDQHDHKLENEMFNFRHVENIHRKALGLSMYLTSPPVCKVSWAWMNHDLIGGAVTVVENSEGVKWRDVLKAVGASERFRDSCTLALLFDGVCAVSREEAAFAEAAGVMSRISRDG